jgi:CRP-like cAMP-binding protein/formate hydrogenlyase subunit 6/NADH:ubiquinone oxidoreductase subunit I
MSTAPSTIRLTIDDQPVEVPAGTTIYDAATRVFVKDPRAEANPIPVLCHREHMRPVAVCRVCTVEIRLKGRPAPEWRLFPACQREAEDGMEVRTHRTSKKVSGAIMVLLELLQADQPTAPRATGSPATDFDKICEEFQVTTSRFPRRVHDRGQDDSSVVIAVDHNACILCDRCIRGCAEVRNNNVIGRMGKGYTARIAFDLDELMGNSTCVACGECMISCPTTALSSRTLVGASPWKGVKPAPLPLKADQLAELPLFQGVAEKFLGWNEGSIARRTFKKDDIICREGDFGSTAFYIEKGQVEILLKTPIVHVKEKTADQVDRGLFGLMRRLNLSLVGRDQEVRDEEKPLRYIHVDAPVSLKYDHPVATLGPGDIFGEMTCMSSYPRSATVRAMEEVTVLEFTRNVLYILQRSKASRAMLEDMYRKRAVDNHLRTVPLFATLLKEEGQFQQFVDYLRPRVQLQRINPGQVIFRQGDPADSVYLVRIGFVKVAQQLRGGEHVITYTGPGGYFGEIGLLSHLPEIEELGLTSAGMRTATCSAIDDVDVVSITGADFHHILEMFPALKAELLTIAKQRLRELEEARRQVETVPLGDFLAQGLQNATSLLVLDLEKCTRCDECTRACSDAHADGVTRLIREGLRFDKYLVASSCRSCMDPYCMVGCPVDAIHRRPKSREIIIENWCIGCGKCSENCPYGNINMHPFPTKEAMLDPETGARKAVVRQKATTCDLCAKLPDKQPSCVYACPHDAAHRMTGKELLGLVRAASEPGA